MLFRSIRCGVVGSYSTAMWFEMAVSIGVTVSVCHKGYYDYYLIF